MKINRAVYASVQSEPFDVQELDNGGKIELHSLNANEQLYNEYAPKAKFALWTSQDGKNYRLLLEDGYYLKMRELYTRRVNQIWTGFWDTVEKGRKKVMLTIFLPSVIVAFLAAVLLMIFAGKLQEVENGNIIQYVVIGVVMVGFIVCNVITNKKIDKLINDANQVAIDDIKNIVGHKHFDELMDGQQEYYDEFFGITNEEEEQPVEEEQEQQEVLEEPKEESQEEQAE